MVRMCEGRSEKESFIFWVYKYICVSKYLCLGPLCFGVVFACVSAPLADRRKRMPEATGSGGGAAAAPRRCPCLGGCHRDESSRSAGLFTAPQSTVSGCTDSKQVFRRRDMLFR